MFRDFFFLSIGYTSFFLPLRYTYLKRVSLFLRCLVGITPWLNGSKKTGTLKIPRAFAILGIFTENFGGDVYVCV